MPTRKKPSRSRKPGARKRSAKTSVSGAVSAIAAKQLRQLRNTVAQLQKRLEKEVMARSAAAKMIADARKARDALMGQIKSLRDQGSRLAAELKKALGDAAKREAARHQAVEKMAELRAELTRRTEELKRKSEELAKLAVDSAGRAKDIIMSESSPVPTAPPKTEGTAPPAHKG
jgi:chromosome segregation ATPase